MFNIVSHWRNANQKHKQISPHTYQSDENKTEAPSAGGCGAVLCASLTGVYNGTVTMEISLAVSYETSDAIAV